MVLLKKYTPAYNLVRLKRDWLQIFGDSKSALFVSRNSSLVEPLRQAVDGFVPPEGCEYFP